MTIPEDLQREISDLALVYRTRLQVASKGRTLDGLPAAPTALAGGYYLDSRRKGDDLAHRLVLAGVDQAEADAAIDAVLPYPDGLDSWEACCDAAGQDAATAPLRYAAGHVREGMRSAAGSWSTRATPQRHATGPTTWGRT